MRTMKHWAMAAMAAAALALAGCGGGGSPPQASGPTPAETQYMMVSDAITAAETAVGGLAATSSDADVTAAETAIDAARTALHGADLLSGNQVVALRDRLGTIEGDLDTAQTAIDDHRQMVADNEQLMTEQRTAANTAIDMANTAVAGLSATSTDEEVMAAKDEIQAAKDAVTAATALSMSDRDGLNERISNIETMLASTESDITDHRQMVADENQRMGVSTAIDAAMAAVGALDAMSTDDDVSGAEALIAAAKTALSEATSLLTAEQALTLNARISTVETTLATIQTAIAAYRLQEMNNAETQRVAAVEAARSAAMRSYMDADGDAILAEAAADAAEEAAPGSAGAMAARTAADAARVAANAAMAAHDAIMDGDTKEVADLQASEAATQAGNANSSYMTAKMENDTIQTAKATTEEQQRIRDIADATDAADDAAMAAREAATMARENATKARQAANDANAAYMRAVAGRTDSSAAKTQADAAAAAATMAENAATAAEMAADDAEAAHMGIDPAGSGEAAKMAQTTAVTEQGKAETAQGTASTQYITAMTASGVAATAASEHVLSLFLAANGAHVMDLESTMDVNETAMHVASVGTAMAAIAAAADGNQAAGTTATMTWPADTPDDPDTMETDESAAGPFGITVNVAGGTSIVSEFRSRAATDLNEDGDMTDEGEPRLIQTAKVIAGLGVFRGYELWEDDGMPNTGNFEDRARAIVFTDKTQDEAPVEAADEVLVVNLDNVVPVSTQIDDLGTKSGNNYLGVKYDHDNDAQTDPIEGTLTCHVPATCSVSVVGDTITLTDYRFTGSREGKDAVTGMDAAAQAAANNDYLVFGIWSEESDDGNTDTFGAFAAGGEAAPVVNVVTGTATYTGKAAGAHHKTGEGVNWFHGDARLTANFGAIDTETERGTDPPADTSPGTISGEISNIRVGGGPALSDSIVLRQADLTENTATFNGNARMGAAMVTDDDMVEYPFNGSWSGSFFGNNPAVPDDAGTANVDESMDAAAADAVAGTFGVTKSEGTGDDTVVESFVGAFGAHKQ